MAEEEPEDEVPGEDPDEGGLDQELAADVRRLIAREGIDPLPAPPNVDDATFALGQALFFDPILSGNFDVSCATCHLPEFAGGDGRTLPDGVGGIGLGPNRGGGAVVPRNSPSVLNMHLLDSMFWDGRVERAGGGLNTPAGDALTDEMRAVFQPGLELLAAQAMFPPTSREEMRGEVGESELGDLEDEDLTGIWEALMDRLLDLPGYREHFAAAYPATAVEDLTFANAANAIAGFEVRAFAGIDSPFEAFVRGDDDALDEEAAEGVLEFFGAGNCDRCHSGPAFTDEEFHNIGLAQFGPGKGNGPNGNDDFGRENVTGSPRDRYRFRTPSLRNVELTAPYGHVGQFATLESFVDHYRDTEASLRGYDIAAHVDNAGLIDTFVPNTEAVLVRISDRVEDPRRFQVDEIVAFLESLTAESARDLSDIVPASVPSGLTFE